MSLEAIELLAFHPIDLTAAVIVAENIAGKADLVVFVETLLKSLYAEEGRRRAFRFARQTTEVRQALEVIVSNAPIAGPAQTIAERLHGVEKRTQEKLQHLTKIQRGSLLQIRFLDDKQTCTLIVKVDSDLFLDENDFLKHAGLPFERKLLKACLAKFSANGDEPAVTVFDSNNQFAEYWCKDFLELEELRSDENNTRNAFFSIEQLLGKRLKLRHKSDHTFLRNNLVRYFRTASRFVFDDMLDHVFGSYQPDDKDVKVADLRKEAEKLPSASDFDRSFAIRSDVVKSRYKQIIALTETIDLELKADIKDLGAIIEATSRSGAKGIFIKSEEGYARFHRPKPPHAAAPTGS